MQMRQEDIDLLAAVMYRDIAAWLDLRSKERGEKDEDDRIPTRRFCHERWGGDQGV